MAAEDPDKTNTDEHGQREIPRTTSTRETETMCACICESYESMGKRTKREFQKQRVREDDIAERRSDSLSHYDLAHKLVPCSMQ